MKWMDTRNSLTLFVVSVFLVGCGVKKYQPTKVLDNSAWVQIDGSKSRGSLPIIGAGYTTFLHIWRMYPETCEGYYLGAIKAKKKKSSRRIPLPAGVPIQIFASRERVSHSGGNARYSTNQSRYSINRSMHLIAKAGYGYVVTVDDRDSQLYDFTLTENGAGEKVKIPLTTAVATGDCNEGFTTIKRLR
jgi:hypothetical protein